MTPKYGMTLFIVGDSFQYEGGIVPTAIYSTRQKAEEVAESLQCVEQLFDAMYCAAMDWTRPTRYKNRYIARCHYEVVEAPWYWATV